MVLVVVVISVLSNVQMVSLQKRLKRQNVFKKAQSGAGTRTLELVSRAKISLGSKIKEFKSRVN